MAAPKSLIDCPAEVMTMIFKECTQPDLLALMRVNKCLLDLASLTFYSRLHITVKDAENLIQSHRSSSNAPKGGICGSKWKDERMRLIPRMTLVCPSWEYNPLTEHGGRSDFIHSLIDHFCPKDPVAHVKSLAIRTDPWAIPLALAIIGLVKHVVPRNFCDATSSSEVYNLSGDDQRDLQTLGDWLMRGVPRQPDILTLHNVDAETVLWTRPGKVTRICVTHRHGEYYNVTDLVHETAGILANLISKVEQPGSPYEWEGDIEWEVYQNSFNELQNVLSDLIPWPDMSSEQDLIERAARDQDITRQLEAELIKRCIMAKDRIKVFTAAETHEKTCEGCGRSMDYDHEQGWCKESDLRRR